MSNHGTAVTLIVVSLFVVRFAMAHTNASDDMAKLQGTWQAVSFETNGVKESEEVLEFVKWRFKGNRLFTSKAFTHTVNGVRTVKGKGGTVCSTYKLDDSKEPRVLVSTTVRPFKGIVDRSIYELKGDTLTVCGYEDTAKKAPLEFSAKRGSGCVLVVLKRLNR